MADVEMKNYKVKLQTETIKAKLSSEKTATKILMLKGEKGDKVTKISELQNDAGFITNIVDDLTNYYKKTETYTKTEVDGMVSAIPKFKIEVVNSLPTQDISSTTVYLLRDTEQADGDLYEEYIYVNNTWELLGRQKVDLSGYYTKTETDTLLSAKANQSTTYTKTEVDTALSGKANTSTTYTKTETDNLLDDKADQSTTYTKTEVDNALSAKANTSTTYTKTETDTLLNDKASSSALATTNSNVSANTRNIATNAFDIQNLQVTRLTKGDLIEGTNISLVKDGSSNNVTISSTGEANVQSNWNEADTSSDAYIQNKPTLSTVATSGSYNDLSNQPTIPTVPTNVSAFTNDAGYISSIGAEAVDTYQLADGAVTGTKIADETIEDINLADGAVTTDKLDASAVTTAKIANKAVTPSKLDYTKMAWTTSTSANATCTSSSYNQVALSPEVSITVPTEVGGIYKLTMNATISTDKDSTQTIFSGYIGSLSGTRVSFGYTGKTLANIWAGWNGIGIFTAESTSTKLIISAGAASANTKVTLLKGATLIVERIG